MDTLQKWKPIGACRLSRVILSVIFLLLALSACAGTPQEVAATPSPTEPAAPTAEQAQPAIEPQQEEQLPVTDLEVGPLAITSPVIQEGEPIPADYSCDGVDESPPLEWSGTPQGTESFTLIMDDPDAPAGTWIHWVLFNIPGDAVGLPGSIPAEPILEDGSTHAENSWGRSDYGGPCPPGGTHRYFFKLYALDVRLDLPPGAPLETVLESIEGHVLAEASLMGTYTR